MQRTVLVQYLRFGAFRARQMAPKSTNTIGSSAEENVSVSREHFLIFFVNAHPEVYLLPLLLFIFRASDQHVRFLAVLGDFVAVLRVPGPGGLPEGI